MHGPAVVLEHFFNALMTSYIEQVNRKPSTHDLLSRLQPALGNAVALKFLQNSLLSASATASIVKTDPSLCSVICKPRDLHKRVFTYLKKRVLLPSSNSVLFASRQNF